SMSGIARLHHFDGTRSAPRARDRVEDVRDAASYFRREMLARPKVRYYASFELIRVPYPTRYGYLHAFRRLSPFLPLVTRLFVVQFDSTEGLKTLLVSPMDWEHQRATPFFKRLGEQGGPLAPLTEMFLVRKTATVPDVLSRIGLRPEDVDYITYDHL